MPHEGFEKPLILIGASVRAAAWSARRAGFHDLHGVDLFADVDATRLASMRRIGVEDYPAGFGAALASLPPGPVIYTGALENHPRLIDALARTRPIWGNTPPTLCAVRDPLLLARTLRRAGLPALEAADATPAPSTRSWLSKPRRSAGGAGIAPWDGHKLERGRYLQERAQGACAAAIFCGLPSSEAIFLGCTLQLVGETWTGAKSFQYCGSVGPFEPPSSACQQLQKIGRLLVEHFGLRGLFGVDFILDGAALPLEVNPRYTASIEVLERSTGLHSMAWHAAAFAADGPRPEPAPPPGACWGKAIVFAGRDFRFPTSGPWQESSATDPLPLHADIPQAGERIQRGEPVLTVFADGTAFEECIRALEQRVAEVRRWSGADGS